MSEIDLTFIAKQLERVLAERSTMRDDMLVMAARFDRLESKVDTAVNVITLELRGIRNQLTRMNDRIVKLEDAARPQP